VDLKIAAIGWKDSMSWTHKVKLGLVQKNIKSNLLKGGVKRIQDDSFKENLKTYLWKEGLTDDHLDQKIENLVPKLEYCYDNYNTSKLGIELTKTLDEMLLTLEDTLDAPPTIVWVWNAPRDSDYIVSSEFKKPWNTVLCFPIKRDENWLPDLTNYGLQLDEVEGLIDNKRILSSSVVSQGWIVHAVANLSLWNKIWFEFSKVWKEMFTPGLWDIIVEVDEQTASDYEEYIIWKTAEHQNIVMWDQEVSIDETEAILLILLPN